MDRSGHRVEYQKHRTDDTDRGQGLDLKIEYSRKIVCKIVFVVS
jgi:hypothetical protein